jgi:hypothetical protein
VAAPRGAGAGPDGGVAPGAGADRGVAPGAGADGVVAPGAGAGRPARRGDGNVVLVPGPDERVGVEAAELARLLRAAGRSGRDTAAALTELGVPRREAYRLAADSAGDPR